MEFISLKMAGKMDYNGRWLMIMATMTAAANSATQGYDGSMMVPRLLLVALHS